MTVTVIRHKRRKHAAFYVTPEGIELRIPARLPNRTVEAILREHKDWIDTRLASLPRIQALPSDCLLFKGEPVPLVRRPMVDTFTWYEETFICPDSWDETQIRTAYEQFLRAEALRYVTARSALYERRLGVRAKKIRIGHQKTRWGSCSSTGTISINVRLMLAPTKVLDYVIAHEWAHLVHFDHSKAFWSTVASIYPDFKSATSWLKANGHTLQIKKTN
ncbi:MULTISPECIES: M48 family metallopeptidase [Exiguobacterium]|uniref:M48 family metallopeptidase n=1 Tax=Exiguobacterium TaxID=33986 RepID=UPI001BED1E1F|nr:MULTISPECIES: SprT family zinc-dependent metalloprotease [Exiguobacterium]MCT4783357.1 M48 family metallopeptidase [Exiguobacterium himgiriensis]